MSRISDLTSKVFEYLNANVLYAVLRNYDGLPFNNPGRDIDILVSKKSFNEIRKQLITLINSVGYLIILHYNIERESFICTCNNGEQYKLIQFDFLFNCEVKGLLLIDAEEILDRRIFNGNIYHVSPEFEYLTKFLYNKLLNHPYPEKYSSLEKQMRANDFVKKEIENIFRISFDKFTRTHSSKLFRKRLFYNLTHTPVEQLSHIIKIFYRKLNHHFYYSGISIGFTGPDGSGKTTIITSFNSIFKMVCKVGLFHFRPTLFSNISDVANNIGIKKAVDKNYSNPHRGSHVGFFNSFLRLLYYSTDFILGYIIHIHKLLTRSQIIIFDRYYTDVIVDSRRSRIFLNHKFLYWFGKLFIPALDYNILLTADRDVILSRKQELDEKGIDEINEKMNYLSKKKGYYLVINNGKPEEAVQKILTLVFEGQHLKNMKRIMKG